MTDRPDWNEWILQKNAEAKEEELKKSDSVMLEKAIQFTGEFGQDKPKHMGARAAAEHNNPSKPNEYKIPEAHLPQKGESKEQHSARIVGALSAKHPDKPQAVHAAAADRAWKHANPDEE